MPFTYDIPDSGEPEFALHIGPALVNGDFHEHGHSFTELVVITGGKSDHIVNGQRYAIGAGDVYVLNDGAVHAFRNARELTLVNVMYGPRMMDAVGADVRALAGYQALFVISTAAGGEYRCMMHLGQDELERIQRTLQRMIAEQHASAGSPARRTLLCAFFTELVALLSRSYAGSGVRVSGPSSALRIADTAGYIAQRAGDDLSLDLLAEHSGLSRRHFARLFRELFGTSPMDYVLARRLEMSVRMLRETTRPVSAIAYACGFNDSNYFARAFKARYGLAPRFARGP